MSAASYRSIPGPSDRVSFFAEQKRNRRRTWRIAALIGLTLVITGALVGAIVTPPLFLLFAVIYRAADLFVDYPAAVSVPFDRLGDFISAALNGEVAAWHLRSAYILWLASGVVVMLAAWLLIRRLFFRWGTGALLAGVGARPPRSDDIEEIQLANVVAEMAIAAGASPPRILLTDGELWNVAVVGSSPADATFVVARGLLDHLDRDETQGLLAHLIASSGNGDPGIGLLTLSLFQTGGFLVSILDLPFSADARRSVAGVAKLALAPTRLSVEKREEVSRLLVAGLQPERMDAVNGFMERMTKKKDGSDRVLGTLALFPMLPLILARVAGWFIFSVVLLFLLGPMIAAAWRTRRHLADATAVQLTRNPSGLARALIELVEHGRSDPHAGWGDLVFAVGPETVEERRTKGSAGVRRDGTFENVGVISSFYPSINSRIVRLQGMGADVEWTARKEPPVLAWLLGCLTLWVVVGLVVRVCAG